MRSGGQNFQTIRSWDGSQDRAFEELCYQLRDPTPPGARLIKLGNPDGGYEWFVRHQNGVEWGWQAKYTSDIDKALPLMESSLKTVLEKRPNCRRLTFCVPFDLPDSPRAGRKTAREKFEDKKKSWKLRLEGASKIKIELWQAGDLVERLAKPEHSGTAWFFWDEEIFGPQWCKTRLDVTIKAAGKRYTPGLNVELPIAFALEGLGRSNAFMDRYRGRRAKFVMAARKLTISGFGGLGLTNELRSAVSAVHACIDALPRKFAADDPFDRRGMLDALGNARAAMSGAYPADKQPTSDASTKAGNLRRTLDRIAVGLAELRSFLNGPACKAAEAGVLVMTGGAGQGKTHLFCDAGQRCVDTGRPGVVLLGNHFAGNRVFTDLSDLLGLPQRGATELLGAMRAAAEASGERFVLLIDALNDSGDPQKWREELPRLLAEVSQHAPWITVGVSVRSSYVDLIDSDTIRALPHVDHPGFDGHEYDAAQRYFASFGLEAPRVPLLLPEFTNPLFLRLYCEAMQAAGTTVTAGHAHITQLFENYLLAKNDEISRALKLDPSQNAVGQAVDAFATALIDSPREWMVREEARALIDGFAPHKTDWPDTLFGQLLAQGILSADFAYQRSDDDWKRVQSVQITFQRFADYRIAGSMVAPFAEANSLRDALRVGEPLRQRVRSARTGLVEALAVLLPERFGIELLDAARWGFRGSAADNWWRATLASIPARQDNAVTDRTVTLLQTLSGRSEALFDQACEVLITVAARPEHKLNARYLHRALSRWSMPLRDSTWGFTTYSWMDTPGPLDRLIRWSAAGPYPTYDDEVIELAAIPLIWTLSSANRIMRDYVTKALCQLLAARLSVITNLLCEFQAVNDPYVLQRLAIITHGAVLIGGPADPSGARECARTLASIVLAPTATPDLLARDAARGALEWCLRADLIDEQEYERSKPPYSSEPPSHPRTLKQLERIYDRRDATREAPGYSSLFASIFHFGDFGRYVIESKVSHFSRYPMSRKVPKPRRRKSQLNPAKFAEFAKTLTSEQLAAVEGRPPEELHDVLSFVQQMALLDAYDTSPPPPSSTYPPELAERWVFERVLSLGWTPERFAEFDRDYTYDVRVGRSGHKPERFGKKYQWIAIHELTARIADNFHMDARWGNETPLYEGPWQFYARQIDPTLPPAKRSRDEDGAERLSETFSSDSDERRWWIPPGPRYTEDQALVQAGWAECPDEVPETADLVLRTDEEGSEWTVLHAYYHWDEHVAEDRDRYSSQRRDMWSHVYGWLVEAPDAPRLFKFLTQRSMMGRWMPEGHAIADDAYLAEMPWGEAAREYPVEWEPVREEHSDDEQNIRVLPAWTSYLWEGNVWDCSIDESVEAITPTSPLFQAGDLRWVPGTKQWVDPSGKVVAEHRATEDDPRSVLLVRTDWLRKVLEEAGWSLVVGRLGEKHLIAGGLSPKLLGGWSEINGCGMLHQGAWMFAPTRIDAKHPVS